MLVQVQTLPPHLRCVVLLDVRRKAAYNRSGLLGGEPAGGHLSLELEVGASGLRFAELVRVQGGNDMGRRVVVMDIQRLLDQIAFLVIQVADLKVVLGSGK